MATAMSSNRPKVLVPRLRMKVTSRQIRTAGTLTTPPSSADAVIETGRATPKPERSASS
jgi:hypothetical protein